MSTEKEIAKYIETGQFTLAIQHAKVYTKTAQDRVESSYRMLREVYHYCYKSNKENNKPLSSEVDNVCELTTILCQTISSTWKCNRLRFMQCLYHINSYLVKSSPPHARKVSEYFFQSKSSSWDAEWDPNQSVIISNIVHDFILRLTDGYREILSSSGENSLGSWLDFMFRLFELHDLKQLYKLFIMLDSLWVKVYHNCNDKLGECVVQCLTKLGGWLSGLTSSKQTVETTDKDVSSFFSLIERTVSILSVSDVSRVFEILETCSTNFKTLCPRHEEDVNILTDCFKFYANIENPSVTTHNFDSAFSKIINRKSKRSAALPIVVTFFIKYRSLVLATTTLIESRVVNISKLLLELMLWAQKELDKPSKQSKMITDLSYVVLSVITTPAVPKDSLIEVFPLVKTIVKLFLRAMPDADDKMNICVGVASILGVVLAFKKIEQFEQPVWLCRYVLQIFLKIDPEVLWQDCYYKSYVATWLRNIVIAYSKCNLGVEVQVMLIVFASYQPKYTIPTMREWATLKTTKCQSVYMDATVLDVINANGEEIEEQFPQLKIADINTDLLLLGEIYGYSKLRELCGDPVLVVYKTAARKVKDHIVLANILCCTVDAFSVTSNTACIAKLEASLNNMLKHLQAIQENGKNCGYDSSVLLCTIGNLFYQKARLEIQQARQKCEVEAAQNEKWNAKKKIPVFRAGEKDDLDMTEVNFVGSTNKLIQDSGVLSILRNAVDFWARCEKTLVPNLILGPTLSFLKGAGYLARMHRYKTLETTCWNLLYTIAGKLDSLKYQVLAASELLFSCRSVDETVTDQMDNVFRNPKLIDRKCYVYHLYRTSYARNLLFCGKIDECQRALDGIDDQAVLPFFLVNAQLTVLRALLDMKRPKREAPLLPIIKLFENVLYIVKNNMWETFNEACVVQCLMFDLSLHLSTIYSDLKYVRHARLYTKTELKMVERLALPVRVCEFMTLKCWVDLLSWNVTDSDVNAREVENMLELGALETDESSQLDPYNSYGSIKCVPHCLNEKDCDCNLCKSLPYPSLVLTAIINRIIILTANGDSRVTQDVINVGLKVVKTVEQKSESNNDLWTPFSASVARFYYIVARTNALWKKYKEVKHYASLACDMLKSEPVENHGLIFLSRQLLLETNFISYFVEPERTVPVSRRFHLAELPDIRAVTPEAQKYKEDKPWDSTTHKPVPKGYYSGRKSIFAKNIDFDNSNTAASGGMKDFFASDQSTPLSNQVETANEGVVQVGNKHGVLPVIMKTHFGEELTFFNRKRLDGDAELKCDDSQKLTLGIPAIDLNCNGATPVAKRNGRKAALVGSSRKVQTEKKSRIPRANLFNAGSISSLTEMTSTTPAVKIFYDPEGVEHSTNAKKKTKTKEVVKRTTRLAALSKAVKDEKFGTPTASKTPRTAIGKLTFDEGSDDELELVVGRKKQDKKRQVDKNIQEGIHEAPVTSDRTSKADGAVNESDQESLVVPFRKVINSRNKNVSSKRLIYDDTKSIEESSEDVDDASESVSGKHSSGPPAVSFKNMLDTQNGSVHSYVGDGKTILTRRGKPLKKAVQVVSNRELSGSEQLNCDESEEENIAAPFRKLLDSKGHERISRSRRLVYDETTITDQSSSESNTTGRQTSSKSDFNDTSDVVPSHRKILDNRGVHRISSSKQIIHDDTTVINDSVYELPEESDSTDLIDSSIVQTTPPKNRRCVALTPLTIEDQMSKLTLATRSTRKRPPTTAENAHTQEVPK